ncbi:hypothetical protein NA57DRAFT_77025 [Rhizodiscina lignyota]|uniref:DNA-binding protein RAP1 n=1 Tax=Rhizodiscina lignyota TaxID=1504668 RepID=A0A9P4M5L9_9PEZI|nr:hypothetical protein NA57DRAFT_77025 [Rhizodiscina lignyota]
MAQVVYTRADGNSEIRGDLFSGFKFFIAQRCPSRSTYVEKVTVNGGELVKLEKHADILIADHAKFFDAPPGSISYKFIDESIRQGTLADVEADEFRVGPAKGSSRPAGSARPAKTGRTPFTAEDDRVLWNWIKDYERKGGSLLGNEIYKQLDAVNTRHTWQSWRDRYVKTLRYKPPTSAPAPVPSNAPPTPPIDQNPTHISVEEAESNRDGDGDEDEEEDSVNDAAKEDEQDEVISICEYRAQDFNDLIGNGGDILTTDPKFEQQAWDAWSNLAPEHSASQWKAFWTQIVLPIYNEVGEESRRSKIYKKLWKPWVDANGWDAEAAAWLRYYEENVRPLFHEEDRDLGRTPEKQQSDEVFKQFSQSGPDSGAREVDTDTPASSPPERQLGTRMDGTADASSRPQSRNELKRSRDDFEEGDKGTSATSKKVKTQIDPINEFIISDDAEEEEDDENEDSNDEDQNPQHAQEDLPPSSPPAAAAKPTPRTSGGNAFDTQAIVDADTQFIDFDIPSPEGGFGDEDDGDGVHYPELPSSQGDPLGREMATQQAIAIAAQQQLDEDVLDPQLVGRDSNHQQESAQTYYETAPETQSKNLPAPSSSRHAPSSSYNSPTPHRAGTMSLERRVAVLKIRQLFGMGHSQKHVLCAVKRTSADPRLFYKVLGALEAGLGVPDDITGVWTEEDDAAIEGGDARGVQRMERKHGWDGLNGVEGRLEFLREWREP